MSILVTGATGFIGSALSTALVEANFEVVTPIRSMRKNDLGRCPANNCPVIDEINSRTKWRKHLLGVDTVVHCAAKTSTLSNYPNPEWQAYKEVNVAGTLNLARQASDQGVKRFIFLSSIRVNGSFTNPGKPFSEADKCVHEGHYGRSKAEAEEGLWKFAETTDMEIVIIRPPLVYGWGASGNFAKLINLIEAGIPLPFASIRNQRSFLAINNLIDFVILCITHSQAANQTFIVSDCDDLSTPQLLNLIALAMGKNVRLFPCPPPLLHSLLSIAGRRDVAQRIILSLQADASKARRRLGWSPALSAGEGLHQCFSRYKQV